MIFIDKNGTRIELDKSIFEKIKMISYLVDGKESSGYLYGHQDDCIIVVTGLSVEEGLFNKLKPNIGDDVYCVGKWFIHTTTYKKLKTNEISSFSNNSMLNEITTPIACLVNVNANNCTSIKAFLVNKDDCTTTTMQLKSDLKTLFASLQKEMNESLKTIRDNIRHSVIKGEATENEWIEFLRNYLPPHYKVEKGKVVDCEGSESHQIDIIIYDGLSTPFMLNKNGIKYIPVEGVLAVFEVKQDINGFIDYASKKIESVRKLKRAIVRNDYDSNSDHPILGGVLTTTCSYPDSKEVENQLKTLKEYKVIDIGCCADSFAFQTIYGNKNQISGSESSFNYYYHQLNFEEVIVGKKENSLFEFLFKLIQELNKFNTNTMIDANKYLESINAKTDILKSEALF